MRKRQVNQANQAMPKSEKDLKLEAGDNKKYEVQVIINSAVYG